MNYILVLIATVLLAFEFAFSRKYQTMEGTSMAAGLRFNFLTGLFTALLFTGKKAEKPKSSPRQILLVAGSAAAISGLSYLLQLIGASTLPATVLYPMVTGGSIIFSALSGKVFFKEKISRCQLLSIVLCFVGTLLFL